LLTVLLIWVEQGALHLLVQPLLLLQPGCFCMNLDHVSNNTRNSLNGLCEISGNSFKTCTQAFMQHMEQENLFSQLGDQTKFLAKFLHDQGEFSSWYSEKRDCNKTSLPGFQNQELKQKFFLDFSNKRLNTDVCLSVCLPSYDDPTQQLIPMLLLLQKQNCLLRLLEFLQQPSRSTTQTPNNLSFCLQNFLLREFASPSCFFCRSLTPQSPDQQKNSVPWNHDKHHLGL
jgi:hypothetical protein